jgi:hypothetical protein
MIYCTVKCEIGFYAGLILSSNTNTLETCELHLDVSLAIHDAMTKLFTLKKCWCTSSCGRADSCDLRALLPGDFSCKQGPIQRRWREVPSCNLRPEIEQPIQMAHPVALPTCPRFEHQLGHQIS